MIFYSIILVLLILFILIGQSKLTINTKFLKDGNNDEFIINLTWLKGLLKYKIEVPLIDITTNEKNKPALEISTEVEAGKSEVFIGDNDEIFNINEIRKLLYRANYFYTKYKKVGVYLKKKTIISKISWHTHIGLDDAALTAVFIGGLWIIKSSMVTFLKNFITMWEIDINISPFYQGLKFMTRFESIIQVKIGYIIIAGIKFLVIYLSKDGDKVE